MFSYPFLQTKKQVLESAPFFRRLAAVTLALSWLVLTLQLQGQVTTAEILGIATDPSGAAIPEARVTIWNRGTNDQRVGQTDANGNYGFTLLPTGQYSIEIEHVGFKTFTVSNVALGPGDKLKEDARLEVGETQQTIEVTAAPPALETQSSTLGTLVDEHAMQDLPLNGRNFTTLAQLAPGANNTSQGFSGGNGPDDRRQTSTVTVNGQYPWANNFLIDGMDNNERFIGTVIVKPDVEAISQMAIQTNLYAADVGRTAGGVINLITKSGSNAFHGSLFEFFRNEHLDARNYFVANAGDPIPPYKQNQYGGSFGGPIRKNRTFFFGSYEGLHIRQGLTYTATVPTLTERSGNFAGIARIFDPTTTTAAGSGYVRTEFLNDQIPAGSLNPIALKLINLYPNPTNSGLFNNYVTSPTQKLDENSFDGRVDQKISDNDSLFVRYTFAKDVSFLPEALPLGTPYGFGGTSTQPTQGIQLNYVHIFSPKVVMELRGGYSRYHISSLPVEYGTNYSQQIGLVGSNVNPDSSGLATFNPNGAGTGIGDSTYVPEYNIDNVYQGSGNITFEQGKHSIKAGGEYRRRQDAQWQSPSPAGFFNFSSEFTDDPSGAVGNSGNAFASLMLGYPYSAQRQLELARPLYQFSESAVFVQDDWRATRWLTLNAGVRWSYYSPLSERYDRISNFNLSTAQVVIAGQSGTSNTAGQEKDWLDFAPRFGFAATLSKATVLRGGYGISYVPLMMGSNYAFRNAPFVNSWSETSSLFPTYSISQGLPAATASNPAAPTGTFNAVSFKLRTPYVEQYNITLEQQLPAQFVLNLSYVGLLGRQQPFPNGSVDYNAAAPSPLPNLQQRRPYYAQVPTLGSLPVYGNYSNTSYNAFQMTVQKRFQNGFDAVANYTWSHAIDNFDYLPTATGGMFVRGDSDLDVRQRFTLTANYVLPFAKNARGLTSALAKGWNVNAILQAQTGLPFTVTDAGDQANIGCSGICLETPELVGNPLAAGPVMANSNVGCHSTVSQGGIAPDRIHTLSSWFNPCAFQTQPFGTYGDLGKDTGRGPGLTQLDVSAFKDFTLTERVRLQFRGELFNVLNHPNFQFTSATISLGSGFGTISSAGVPRNIQLALKIVF